MPPGQGQKSESPRCGIHDGGKATSAKRMGTMRKAQRRIGFVVQIVLGMLAVGASAQAQEKGAKGVISIREVVIVGRVQKPVASLDVNKIQPKLTLAELRQPFLDRIEEAVTKEPF